MKKILDVLCHPMVAFSVGYLLGVIAGRIV